MFRKSKAGRKNWLAVRVKGRAEFILVWKSLREAGRESDGEALLENQV